jgi:hypothetical protein
MTSIKPPTGPTTTLPHTPSGLDSAPASDLGAHAAESSQRTADSERAGLEHAGLGHAEHPGDLSSVSQGHAAGASASLGNVAETASTGSVQQVNLVDLARAVETGQLTMGQAVERLVEGTVGSLPAQLTELERAELSELLRQAVANDPALSAMGEEQR